MTLDELVRSVKKIDIASRFGSKQRFAGSFKSNFRGSGYTFDKVRKYEVGDDVRNINWSATARFRETYINCYSEEKQQHIWLLIDVSASNLFGTGNKTKIDLVTEISASLAYSSLKNNDHVGIIFFAEKIEKIIYPQKGLASFWHIAASMIAIKPTGKATDLCGAINHLANICRRNSMIFIVSDFIAPDYENACKLLSHKHELIAIRVYDKGETKLPPLGWVKILDAETKTNQWIKTSSAAFNQKLTERYQKTESYFFNAFADNNAGALSISTDDDFSNRLFEFMSTSK
jgi:uncharacterized protein (DUF58 family)